MLWLRWLRRQVLQTHVAKSCSSQQDSGQNQLFPFPQENLSLVTRRGLSAGSDGTQQSHKSTPAPARVGCWAAEHQARWTRAFKHGWWFLQVLGKAKKMKKNCSVASGSQQIGVAMEPRDAEDDHNEHQTTTMMNTSSRLFSHLRSGIRGEILQLLPSWALWRLMIHHRAPGPAASGHGASEGVHKRSGKRACGNLTRRRLRASWVTENCWADFYFF